MASIRNRTDLILALFYSEDNLVKCSPIKGITRLEKLVFLLREEEQIRIGEKPSDSFQFFSFRMGPYSQEIYDEIDFLESLGLISKRHSREKNISDIAHDEEIFDNIVLDEYQKGESYDDEGTQVFELTSDGRQKAKEIWDKLTQEERTKIMNVKRRFNNMNLKQFLRYVYKKYPEYTTESEIKEYLGI